MKLYDNDSFKNVCIGVSLVSKLAQTSKHLYVMLTKAHKLLTPGILVIYRGTTKTMLLLEVVLHKRMKTCYHSIQHKENY